MDVEALLDVFRHNSLAAASAHRVGKVRKGNRKRDVSHAAYLKLEASSRGRAALRALLDDPDRVIQLDVGGRMLPDSEAEAKLEAWAATDDDRGRQAAFVLKYFRLEQVDPGVANSTAQSPDES